MAQTLPPGVRIHNDPSSPKRRSLRATRAFSPGSAIATFANPLLALPDGATMRTACNYCLRTTAPSPNPSPSADQNKGGSGSSSSSSSKKTAEPTFKACTACKAAVYCGPACQRAHWKAGHKAECKMFGRVREQAGKDWLPTPVRAVAQVLLTLQQGKSGGSLEADMRRAFIGSVDADDDGLEGNVEGFKKDEEVWKDLELQATAAVVYAGLLQSEEVLEKAREILCKIQTNAFNRLDADTGTAGIFLDPGLAMVNHSCVPNAFIGFDKRTAILRAERPIQEGEEITISYIDNTLPKAARYEALRLYHFQCDCVRCQDDLDVYDVCQSSPVLSLNSFSLQPDLAKLQDPPGDRTKVSKAELEAIHKKWQAIAKPDGDDEESHLKLAKERWKVCRPLVEARMWAAEPLPTTILQLATSWQTSYKKVVYALPLFCFLSTECDPYKFVAPFMPWRIKNIVAIVKLLAVTGELTASGALATRCSHEGLVGTLATADQVSICEALLRLAVHHGSSSVSDDWDVFTQAKSMLEDVESLKGREQESEMLRTWIQDPEDPRGAAFFENQVLRPIQTLSSFAVDILESTLGGESIAKK